MSGMDSLPLSFETDGCRSHSVEIFLHGSHIHHRFSRPPRLSLQQLVSSILFHLFTCPSTPFNVHAPLTGFELTTISFDEKSTQQSRDRILVLLELWIQVSREDFKRIEVSFLFCNWHSLLFNSTVEGDKAKADRLKSVWERQEVRSFYNGALTSSAGNV